MKVNNNESPVNFNFGGNIASMIQAAANRAPGQSQTAAMLGGSLSGQGKALFNANQGINQQQQSTGTTGGALSNAAASVMNTGQTPSATSTTSEALAGATPDSGMPSGVNTQSGGDIESRITALEQNAPSNTLGAAQPVFKPQAQQAAQGIYGQQQVPGTFDRSLDPIAAAPLMKNANIKI